MKFNERMEKFLELQNKNVQFEDISKELGITPGTLRTFLNKRGYKSENGKYILKENSVDNKDSKSKAKQIKFDEVEVKIEKKTKVKNNTIKDSSKNQVSKNNTIKKSVSNKVTNKEVNNKNIKGNTTDKKKISENKNIKKSPDVKKVKPKTDRKINITQEDLDKLCEVYDWYLEVKDYKSMKPKKATTKKDINIEDKSIEELKSTSIRVDKKVWDDFERLCSNSEHTKQEIITQALKDFMKQYKNLL